MSDDSTLYKDLVLRLKTVAYHQARQGMTVMSVKLIFIDGELRLFSEPSLTIFDRGNQGNGDCTAAKEALIQALQ